MNHLNRGFLNLCHTSCGLGRQNHIRAIGDSDTYKVSFKRNWDCEEKLNTKFKNRKKRIPNATNRLEYSEDIESANKPNLKKWQPNPLHKSCTFTTIAKTLRCRDKSDYERMVFVQIQRDGELAEKLKKRIGPLSETLDQTESRGPL